MTAILLDTCALISAAFERGHVSGRGIAGTPQGPCGSHDYSIRVDRRPRRRYNRPQLPALRRCYDPVVPRLANFELRRRPCDMRGLFAIIHSFRPKGRGVDL